MRRGKTKYVSSERSEKGAKHTVRKTKRSTAGQTRPKVFEKDPLALPKKIKYAGRGRPPKSPNKVKIVTPLPTKAARKQPAEEEEYEVEQIIAHRAVGCDMSYRIRWKGWGAKDDTWQLEHELNCDKILRDYKESIRASLNSTPAKKKSGKLSGSPKKKKGSPKKSPKKGVVAKGRVTKKPGRKLTKSGNPPKKRGRKPAASAEWEVEEVVAVRTTEAGLEEFLVKWKGYSSEENTWEPEENVANCEAEIAKFRQSQDGTNANGDASKDDKDSDDEEKEKEARDVKDTSPTSDAGDKSANAEEEDE